MFNALEKLRKGSRQNLQAPNSVIDWRPIVHEMRLFKSAEELAVMRRAGEITALAHTRAMEKCRPGMFEYQLEGEILHEFNRHGARFPPITPSLAAAKTAVFCTTPKTNLNCTTAI
ncbi:Xaa-Pro aminopeptidase [Serratia liquefaciens]|nr:Xaa-Pro aminopeptidase [Serratia liquefaciens]